MENDTAKFTRHVLQQTLDGDQFHSIVRFLDRDTATLVSKSWRVAKNQQMIRVECHRNISDAAITALADHCPKLGTINLFRSTNITDAAKDALRSKKIEVRG